MKLLKNCTICPRNCHANRYSKAGFCGARKKIKIAKVMLADFEEPCISVQNGSGAIFFSGCNLKCVFCQNYKISYNNFGKEISVNKLVKIMQKLENNRADNINLITGSHYIPQIAKALKRAKLKIPVIFNCGGYENVESLKLLDGLVNIYLPDFKYGINEIAIKYSHAPNYPQVALAAIHEMVRQTGKFKIGHSGKMLCGVIVRHLILPNNIKNSLSAIDLLNQNFNENEIIISLMAQYTPQFKSNEFPEINSSIAQNEYNKVLKKLHATKFNGYTQDLSSTGDSCIPEFDLSGF